jgi:hypothetical protein
MATGKTKKNEQFSLRLDTIMATLKSFMANKAAEREERNNSVPDGADHMVINLRS